MPRERLYLFDTTLRDGAQTNGVDFTLADKIAIARMLDDLGIDYVEGGYPGANPTDTELFAEKRDCDASFTAFGMTRRPGRSASNDPGLVALLDAKADAICFVAKTWDYHVRVALETTPEENIASIRDSVRAAKAEGLRGAARLRAFLRRLQGQSGLRAGLRQGRLRRRRALGGAVRHQRRHAAARGRRRSSAKSSSASPAITSASMRTTTPSRRWRISLAAVRAGARQIQGTLNGLGERCGNANLVSIIPTLKLKPEYADRFDIGVSDDKLKTLAHASHTLDEMLNRAPNRHAPYVGDSAFATKAGIHASAIMKDPATYEHVPPSTVGNRRKLLVSDQAGRSNVLAELDRIGHQGRQGRSARRPSARRGEGARGDRLCLRGGRRLLRIAGATRARAGAELFRRRPSSTSTSSSATTPRASA